MRLRLRVAALFCLWVTLGLQGCLLTRVLETRRQLCDEQPPRVIVIQQPGRGLRVLFKTPTLTDRDVVSIVGHEPTQVTGTDAFREVAYEALPLDRPLDRKAGLVVRFSFVRLDGEFRLSQVEIPEKFNAILPPSLLDAAVGIACKTQFGLVPPSTTFDLGALDRSTLPTRGALTQLLGTPTTAIAGSGEALYEYCLAPCNASLSRVAKLRFGFGLTGDLHRAEATYFRYSAVVDMVSSRPTATIRLQ